MATEKDFNHPDDHSPSVRQVGGHWHGFLANGKNNSGGVIPLTVQCIGKPAPGGAYNLYSISGFQVPDWGTPVDLMIPFHSGNPQAGWKGVTMESLVAVVIDRLKGLQHGLYPCEENDRAMACFEEGLKHLHARSKRVEDSLEVAARALAEQKL